MPQPFNNRRVIARMGWWALLAPVADAQPVDVLIYGDVGSGWWSDGPSTTALSMVEQIQQLGAVPLNVRINSYGGSVMDGIAIYNALKNHSAPVTCTIDGFAVSIASLIAMAGSSVKMYANSMLMVHAPWGMTSGNSSQLRADADALDAQAQAMATSYASKTGMSQDATLALLTDGIDHWMTAAQAVELGYADAIIDDASAQSDDLPDPDTADESTEDPMQMAAAVFGKTPFDLSRFKNLPAAAAAMSKELQMKFKNVATQYHAPAGDDGAAAGAPGSKSTPADPAIGAAAVATARSEAAAALAERNAGITQMFAAFRARNGIADLERECLASTDISVAQAQTRLLSKLGENAAPAGGAHVSLTADARDQFRAGASAALLARAGIEKPKTENGNEFRGHTLLELARASLKLAGQSSERMDKMQAVAAAFTYTGSDFTLLLANIAEKAMLKGYQEAGETFQQWTTKGELPDFKQALRADLTQFPSLDQVEDGGEYKTVQGIGDRGEYIQLATYGKLFAITRQTVINDDLNAMSRVPQYMGRAAIRTVGNLVYAVLTGNPTMRDTVALFHATHGNLMSAAGITTASVDAIRVAMGTQKENGATLAIPLKNLIVPVALGGQARTVRDSQYQVDAITTAKGSQNTIPNSVRGIFGVIEESRLDAYDPQAWFAAADNGMTDTIEVAYLDGNDQPFLDQQLGWGVDGTQFKVRLDAGVRPLDYRTLFKNPGH